MRVALTIETSIGVEDGVHVIVDFSNKLSEYFSDKEYGNDVQKILIGVICVAPEFEWFSKVRKPKYSSYRKYTTIDGIELTEDRLFGFDLKIDYEDFRNQTDEQNNKMLAFEILNSLSHLDRLPKKVKDFDREKFKEDMKVFFIQQRFLIKN